MRKDEFPIVDKVVKDSISKVLDEIKEEIEVKCEGISWRYSDYYEGWYDALNWVCDNVLDKYKAESEDE